MTFAKKTDLASLKLDFNRLDIDTLKTTSVDLRNLSDVIKNKVCQKDWVWWIKMLEN